MSRSPAAHLSRLKVTYRSWDIRHAKLDSVSVGAIHHVHITHPAHPP